MYTHSDTDLLSIYFHQLDSGLGTVLKSILFFYLPQARTLAVAGIFLFYNELHGFS